MKRQRIHESFEAALKHVLKEQGWGSKTALAKRVGISPQYMSQLANGERKGDEELRHSIARELGFSYEDFLAIGRKILNIPPEEKERFPYSEKLTNFPVRSDARAFQIYQLAAQELGLPGMPFYNERNHLSPGVEDYLDGKIDDMELLKLARKEVNRQLDLFKEALRKRDDNIL